MTPASETSRSGLLLTPVVATVVAVLAIAFTGWTAAIGLVPPPQQVLGAGASPQSTPPPTISVPAPRPSVATPSAAAPTASATPGHLSPTPSRQAASPTYPAVIVGEGQECGRFGSGPWDAVGTYNATTSCPFALNVRQAYIAAGLKGTAGTINAYSPTTKKDYVMTCSGTQPARCEGGVAARVMIYGGQFILVTTTE